MAISLSNGNTWDQIATSAFGLLAMTWFWIRSRNIVIAKERSDCGNLSFKWKHQRPDRHVGLRSPRDDSIHLRQSTLPL